MAKQPTDVTASNHKQSVMLDSRAFFEEFLPVLVKDRASKGALPKLVATFQIVGDNSATWTLRCDRKEGALSEADATDAQLRFITSDAALSDILAGKLDAKTALMSHAMTIQGDWSLLPSMAFMFTAAKPTWARF